MKTKSKRTCIFLWLLALLAVIASCTPESCLEETNTFVNATFYINDGSGSIKAPDTLTIYGSGKEENLLYNKTVNRSTAKIPLDASTGSCIFILKINNITDIVTFNYTSYPHFISKECGYTFYHSIESVHNTKNIIDTIFISNNSVLLSDEENIRIYY